MRIILFIADLTCFASFGWAMLCHFRRNGRMKPGTILIAVSVPVFAAAHLAAIVARPPAHPLAALSLFAGSLTLFWSTVAATRGRNLAACFQGQPAATVVRTGPYRLIRHPFYTAYTLTWTGGFAATGWWPAGAIAGVMAGVYYCAARQEELDFLHSPLREEYLLLMSATGRFLPRLCRSQ